MGSPHLTDFFYPWKFPSAGNEIQTPTYGPMRSKLDHRSAAGPTLTQSRRIKSIDGSYPHFRSIPSSQFRWWGQNSLSEATVNPTLLLGFPPLGGSTLPLGFPHSKVRIATLLWVLPPLRVDASNLSPGRIPTLRPPFAGKYSGEPIIAQSTWYIHMRVSLFGLSPRRTISCN